MEQAQFASWYEIGSDHLSEQENNVFGSLFDVRTVFATQETSVNFLWLAATQRIDIGIFFHISPSRRNKIT